MFCIPAPSGSGCKSRPESGCKTRPESTIQTLSPTIPFMIGLHRSPWVAAPYWLHKHRSPDQTSFLRSPRTPTTASTCSSQQLPRPSFSASATVDVHSYPMHALCCCCRCYCDPPAVAAAAAANAALLKPFCILHHAPPGTGIIASRSTRCGRTGP